MRIVEHPTTMTEATDSEPAKEVELVVLSMTFRAWLEWFLGEQPEFSGSWSRMLRMMKIVEAAEAPKSFEMADADWLTICARLTDEAHPPKFFPPAFQNGAPTKAPDHLAYPFVKSLLDAKQIEEPTP